MEWQDYYKSYLAFDLSICHLTVETQAAYSILDDFPNRLPESWQERISTFDKALDDSMVEMLRRKHLGDLITTDEILAQVPDIFSDEAPGLLSAIFHAYVDGFLLGHRSTKESIQFVERLYEQQIIMALAYLDAFIANTIRVICRLRPETLKSKRKIEWETVIEAQNWQGIIDRLVEEYVYEFGWQSIVSRIARMEELFGLTFGLPPRITQTLEIAELVRNLLMHNGGVVSQEFLDRTKPMRLELDEELMAGHSWVWAVFAPSYADRNISSLELGIKLEVRPEFAEGLTRFAQIAAGEVFVTVSEKFFGKDKSEITGVRRLVQE